MDMQERSSKDDQEQEEDVNLIASKVTAHAIWGETVRKNPAAVELGRLGGLKGGRARAEKLSAKKRRAIAKKAALARWEKERHRP